MSDTPSGNSFLASLSALPQQILAGAPAWYWRYLSVAAITFLMLAAADRYLGSPVTGVIRAWSAQKEKTIAAKPDTATLARMSRLEEDIASLRTVCSGLKLEERKREAIEVVLSYTVGRVTALETAAAPAPSVPITSEPKPKPRAKPVKTLDLTVNVPAVGGAQ